MKINISVSHKIMLGFALALIVLVVIGVVSFHSTIRFAESFDVVGHTHESISDLKELLHDTVSAESEVRGYIITGDDRFLTLYNKATSEVEGDIRTLKLHVKDPYASQQLVTLEKLIQERLEILKAAVEKRQQPDWEEVLRKFGPGKQIMDELRALTEDIEARQMKLLAERAQDARALSRRTISVVIAGSLIAAFVAATSVIVLSGDMAHRARLEKEVIEISEREQRRIGQDLHDGVCQHLTGISLFSRSLQEKLSGQQAADAAKITDLINDTIEQTRQVTRGLHPVPDEPTGLMFALKELAGNVRTTAGTICKFDCPSPVPVPSHAAATNLYRIAQEAVQNALRHAEAKMIVIELKWNDESIRLAVRDDGRGLPEQRTGNGMGLEIMGYRAQTIGAKLDARRGETGGTVVTCTLPRENV